MASQFVAQRLRLNSMAASFVGMPANDNEPVAKGVVDRRVSLAAKAAPTRRHRAIASKIVKRQSIGEGYVVPENDNDAWPLQSEAEAWPLRDQLQRDGNTELLRVAERYRAIYDAVHLPVELIGTVGDDTYSVEQKHARQPNGAIKRNGIKRARKRQPLVTDGASRVYAMDEGVRDEMLSGTGTWKRKPTSPIARRWTGDERLHARIDSEPVLWWLQGALGPLVEVFENAVVHRMSFTEIGRGKGGNTASSAPIGRAYVMDGLAVVQRTLRVLDAETAEKRAA